VQTNDSPYALLQNRLQQEISLVQAFIGILKEEASALEQASSDDALHATSSKKNQSADALASVAGQRNELLSRLGHGADKAGLEAAAQQHPVLNDLCVQLFDLAQRAAQLNAANGQIIETFLAHNQRALDTLRSLAGTGDLYDASGRSRPGSRHSHTTVKAG
jgi:flagella synthesis protein FlgN